MAFEIIDKDGSGTLDISDIIDVSHDQPTYPVITINKTLQTYPIFIPTNTNQHSFHLTFSMLTHIIICFSTQLLLYCAPYHPGV